ncbi:MipA/OmpV family protein [Vibrio genomosp. F10]|uniref:Structural protein MipA n=1 Tax=Vibrio genomosp. F10 TaxID=723171 RepID=A0A1B9R3E4_9VIBR|nr:MipA/OmpV family protein [Vibrio genomosp. F10]OCH78726.1 hypothetical protein A6E14_16760 [Vibrio genomosp. F10]
MKLSVKNSGQWLLVAVLSSPVTTQAEGVFSLGLGAFKGASEYKQTKGKIYTIPFVSYDSEIFSASTLSASYHMPLSHSFWFDATAALRLQGFDETLSAYTKGLAERESSIDAGFAANYLSEYLGLVRLHVMHDVSDTHQGYDVKLSYQYPLNLQAWEITPSIFVQHESDKLVDYYYGVRSNEVEAWRTSYQGRSALRYGAGINITYSFAQNWSLFMMADIVQFSEGITDSPLVDTDTTLYSGLGVYYSF